jgi:hypothetical protein
VEGLDANTYFTMTPIIETTLTDMRRPAIICIGCEGTLSIGDHEILIEFGCIGTEKATNELTLILNFN